MLILKNIVKDYVTGDTTVRALDDVSLAFRKNEFVSILGHSGCGKTTMLNIIGGLDKYTSGVMAIKGVTTEQYRDSDWDTYRNHSIGFVFQSYNLIPHQTVLSNVELALTLSGVSKAERRRRATEVLEKVGLGDQLHKKPSQMSGGQMQRVAIARTLVNDPEILLADEPTGALDTDTSVQIMEILKEISKNKLIIMVTHNPELAARYSDRIIRLSDGMIIDDSNPFSFDEEQKEVADVKIAEAELEENEQATAVTKNKKKKKPSMSFWTALALSFNNLLTKKTRTFLTSFAGSIGIIGIALILSLSNGINAFIDRVQRETLSSYPITIQKEEVDMTALVAGLMQQSKPVENPEPDKVYVNPVTYGMLTSMLNPHTTQNNLKDFKAYLDSGNSGIENYTQLVKYGYKVSINPYLKDANSKYYKADVNDLFTYIMKEAGMSYGESSMSTMVSYGNTIWQEMLPPTSGSDDLMHGMIKEQYDLIAGAWPTSKNEVVLVVTSDNAITDIALYSLGLYTSDEIFKIVVDASKGIQTDTNISYNFDDLIYTGEGDTNYISYKIIPSSSYYQYMDTDGDKTPDKWVDLRTSDSDIDLNAIVTNGLDVKITGIIRPNPEATSGAISGTIAYTSALTDYLVEEIKNSEIVKAQLADTKHDVFTGLPFVAETITAAAKPGAFQSYLATATVAQKAELYKAIITTPSKQYIDTTLNAYLVSLGVEEAKNDREKLIAIVMEYAGQGNEQFAQLYFDGMSADELYKFIRNFAEEAIRTSYASETQAKIDGIINAPNDVEFDAERAKIALRVIYSHNPNSMKQILIAIQQSMGQSLNASPDSMSNAQIYSMLVNVFDEYGRSFATSSNMSTMLMLSFDTEIQKIYLKDRYKTNTKLSDAQIDEILNNASNISVLFYNEFDSEAKENYALNMAHSQSESRKNEKLDAAFEEYLSTIDLNTEAGKQLVSSYYDEHIPKKSPTEYEDNLELMGFADKEDPDSISIYANSFEDKEIIAQIIEDYNNTKEEKDRISYTDYVGLIMSSVTSIINAITYVLIFFVSISLVVSSIMIGIITYISVLERTKEIGILRAIGASKRDISRVFNAETLIVGFASGMIGIIVTVLLNIPITLIIKYFSGISGLATLPVLGGLILVLISMGLTVFAGLIPSGIAAKKDPVESLRSE